MSRSATLFSGLVVLLALTSGSLSAAEYCVTCEGPPALYRCVIDGTPEGQGKDPRASIHCISQMAKQGNHERCGVSRGAPFPCPGLTALVQPQGKSQDIATPAGDHASPYPEPHSPSDTGRDFEIETEVPAAPAEAKAPSAAAPPRTVEELAGQTVRSSKEGLEKAGKAIGGTAKKAGEVVGQTGSAIGEAASTTWNCITSLFTSCSSEPEAPPPGEQPPAE